MINSDDIMHSYTSFNIYSLLIICICLGSLIYNETDWGGWCFTSYCNSRCIVEKQARPCPSTTPATVSTVSTTTESTQTSTSTLSRTTPYPGCEYVIPPRKDGETWKPDNCTTQTCHSGVITTTHVDCKSVETPVCENGYPPVKIYDESGCCYHYECECKFNT
uniref:VWFC domain-containing protein n=1 Tax=Hucho hucho TaxID=62062 RepID=A0A4W5LNW0_9TELE